MKEYSSLSEAHVNDVIEWAQEHPDRMARMRHEDKEFRLQHEVLQSVVDAAVEECIEKFWHVLVSVRWEEDADALRPVASLLRNGYKRADGLDISIDMEERRVVIDIDNEVVTRLHNFDDRSPLDDMETTTVDPESWKGSTPTDADVSLFGGDRSDEV